MSTLTAEQANEGLWDARDVAGYLKASRSWVYMRAEAGNLPCLRIGGLLRFDPAAIRAFARGELTPPSSCVVPISGRTRDQ